MYKKKKSPPPPPKKYNQVCVWGGGGGGGERGGRRLRVYEEYAPVYSTSVLCTTTPAGPDETTTMQTITRDVRNKMQRPTQPVQMTKCKHGRGKGGRGQRERETWLNAQSTITVISERERE